MTINKDGFKRLIITIGISTSIYMLTILLFMKIDLSFLDIMKTVVLGSSIWLISEISFDLVAYKWAHSILPSYITLFIIIALGTISGLKLFGMSSIALILLICGISEICGLTITIISRYMYKKKLNEKLKNFQSH